MDGVPKEDYGSDEDRCRDYLRAMRAALQKGHNVALQAMTRWREWHLVQAYIRGICSQVFRSCFKDRGWLAVETPEMLADWATKLELGPCNTSMEKLACEIVGLYKEVHYACKCAEAKRAVDKVAAKRSLAAEREVREKVNADLASQQVV